jgi:predicted metal-dependent peptidase
MNSIEVIGENVHCNTELNINLEDINDKLVKARAQLILDKPFLGNLVMRLPLKPADSWCKTIATDAKNFYYNPEYVAELSPQQTKFVLIHEALHCALTHFARKGNRQKHRWDLACDFAINPLLMDEGFIPPTNTLMFFEYKGMIAEEIYPLIDDKLDTEPLDQHLYDDKGEGEGGDGKSAMNEKDLQKSPQESSKEPSKNDNQGKSNSDLASKPPPLGMDEVESLAAQWQKNLASSAQLANQSGKLDGKWSKLVGLFLEPRVSWRNLLAQYLSNLAKDDFSYARGSRRSTGNAILPSLHSSQVTIAIALDTSGSISDEEINEFSSEINTLKSMVRAKVYLFAADNKCHPKAPWIYDSWEELNLPKQLGGGGGTDFNPVFDKLETLDTNIDLLVYFTDAKGIFPKSQPNYPVIWLVKGSEQVKWGQRIQLN